MIGTEILIGAGLFLLGVIWKSLSGIPHLIMGGIVGSLLVKMRPNMSATTGPLVWVQAATTCNGRFYNLHERSPKLVRNLLWPFLLPVVFAMYIEIGRRALELLDGPPEPPEGTEPLHGPDWCPCVDGRPEDCPNINLAG